MPLFFIVISLWAGSSLLDWPVLRSAGILGVEIFSDFRYVARSAECWLLGSVIDPDLQAFSGDCNVNVYGKVSLLVVFLLNSSLGSTVAPICLATLLMLQFGGVANRALSTRAQIAFGALLGFSPAIQLLVERGNLDLFIGILCLGALQCDERQHKWVAFACLALASLMKFYTFPALILYLLLRFTSKLSEGLKAGVVVVFVGAQVLIEALGVDEFPKPDYFAFGVSWLDGYVRYFGVDIASVFPWIVGTIVVISIAFFMKTKLNAGWRPIQVTRAHERFLLGTSFFIPIYFVTMSFDYRLILVPIILLLANEAKLEQPLTASMNVFGALGMLLSAEFGVALAVSSGSFAGKVGVAFIQAIGDLSIACFVASCIVAAIIILNSRGPGLPLRTEAMR